MPTQNIPVDNWDDISKVFRGRGAFASMYVPVGADDRVTFVPKGDVPRDADPIELRIREMVSAIKRRGLSAYICVADENGEVTSTFTGDKSMLHVIADDAIEWRDCRGGEPSPCDA